VGEGLILCAFWGEPLMPDFAVPTLPMHDPAETRAFYEKLGFICAHDQPPPDSFLFMIRDGVQLQFFEAPGIDGTIRDHTCYIYVDDLHAWHRSFAAAKVGTVHPIEQKPWGVPEFVLVDINGNTIRVGCPRLEM
jgi:catechol 2,3-dioxygenase-like lactoylglutathione lyase family enzyme